MLSEYEKKVLEDTHERNLKRAHLKTLRKDYELYKEKGYVKYAEAIKYEMQKIKKELN